MIFESTSIDKFCPTLRYDFKFTKHKAGFLIDVLVISFHGKYRNGSAGHPDAGLISGIFKLGVEVFDPFSVLVDISGLEYEWGDDLNLIFPDDNCANIVVLVGNKCRRAISTLLFGLDTDKDIVDNDYFFDDFDKAISKLNERHLS
ncbi:MAG: hypothetical protein ABI480_15955 [Chitinophagaceae bacterium]